MALLPASARRLVPNLCAPLIVIYRYVFQSTHASSEKFQTNKGRLCMIHSLFGIIVLVILCWAISENRRTIPWRLVAGGLGLQLLLALLLLKFPPAHVVFDQLNDGVEALQ